MMDIKIRQIIIKVANLISQGVLNTNTPQFSGDQEMSISKSANSQDIGTIMEMFALQYTQATRIYEQCSFDLNATIERMTKRQRLLPPNIISRPKENPRKAEQSRGGILKTTNIQFSTLNNLKQNRVKQESIKAELQRQEQQRMKQSFRKQYIVRTANKKRNLNYKKKSKNTEDSDIIISQQFGFNTLFQQYLGKPFLIDFREELNDVFDEQWNKRKLIALHLLNLAELKTKARNKDDGIQKDITLSYLKDVYLSQRHCDIFNREFINYGLDPKQFDFITYPHMREFFKAEDRFSFIILRLNHKTSKVKLSAKINFFQIVAPKDFQGFKRKILEKKKDIIRMIDAEICPSIHHNPLDTAQKKKLDTDRSIRAMQQIQYEKMMTKAIEDRQKQRESRIKKGEQSQEQVQRLKQAVVKSIIQQKANERQKMRKLLHIYKRQEIKNLFSLKLRFPSGKQTFLILPKEEKVEYIFNFVECYDGQDLGFQNLEIRSFDLLQPLSSQGLSKDKARTIGQVFNDSDAEVLIVREN